MPIYEYSCRHCGLRFERLVRTFGEAVACPRCSAGEVDRLLSTFAMAGASASGPGPSRGGGGGGCCGGGCGCAH